MKRFGFLILWFGIGFFGITLIAAPSTMIVPIGIVFFVAVLIAAILLTIEDFKRK